jgi:hypothetical protein
MARLIVPQFHDFPEEAAILGQLLAGYGSLEYALSLCVGMARNDLDMVIKAMFRPRGETQRIQVADALGRAPYRKADLENEFSEAIAGMRFCLKIRNQYAHCQWHTPLEKPLCFIDMQEIAEPNKIIADFNRLTFHYIDATLLAEQEMFFVYVGDCFQFLNWEGRKRAGTVASDTIVIPSEMPKKMQRPRLYILE